MSAPRCHRKGCREAATWCINATIFSCTADVGDLLRDGVNTVYPAAGQTPAPAASEEPR